MSWRLKERLIVVAIFVISVNCQGYNNQREQQYPEFGDNYHNSLLEKLNLLIPNVKEDRKPYPQQLQLLQNLLNMIRFLALKLHEASKHRKNDPKIPQYIALRSSVDEALQAISRNGAVDKGILNTIANQLAQLFQETPRVHTHDVAPYCEPGNDCFLDVDHGKIDGNVKSIAQKVSQYIRYRQGIIRSHAESGAPKAVVRAELTADTILAESTVLLGNLHRSIMRNWHHILMIIGNLVGADGGAIHLLDNGLKGRSHSHKPHQHLRDLHIGSFQCKVLVKGNPALSPNKAVCSQNVQPWFQNKQCMSPIKNSNSDCSPRFGGGRFIEVHTDNVGFQFEIGGYWNYKVKIILDPDPNLNITQDVVIGKIDKLSANEDVPKSLIEINNDVFFDTDNHLYPRANEVLQEGTGYFKPGDKMLLRLAETKSNISVLFTAELMGTKKLKNKPSSNSNVIKKSVRKKEKSKKDEDSSEAGGSSPEVELVTSATSNDDDDDDDRFLKMF